MALFWQIIPPVLPPLLQDRDPAKMERVAKAFRPMTKLDIARLSTRD